MFASLAGTCSAGWLEQPEQEIRVDGRLYQGRWAYIGDRPYVNVESFGKILGVPRRHNVKNWYLGSQGNPKGSPFQMAVETGNVKVPTVRYGGATFVDLMAACEAMDIPVHIMPYNKMYEVGDAYAGKYMNGAWKRWENSATGAYRGTSRGCAGNQRHWGNHSHNRGLNLGR